MFPDFVEAGNDVTEVNPGRPGFCHLVKQVVAEKLEEITVARLRPRRVLLKSNNTNSHSNRRNLSLINP